MNNEKFIEELNKVEDVIMSVAGKFTSNYNSARELYQDTVVRAFIKRHTYTENTNFKFWILTILRNNFINNLKYTQRVDYVDDINTAVSKRSLSDSYIDNSIDFRELELIMQELPMVYYNPLHMFLEGYKYYEISMELNIPVSTVKNRIHIARERLRLILKDYLK